MHMSQRQQWHSPAGKANAHALALLIIVVAFDRMGSCQAGLKLH